MSKSSSNEKRNHIRLLLGLTFLSRLLTFIIIQISALFLPPFDSSSELLTSSKWVYPHLRWDAFHFALIAEKGYLYDFSWAFFPGSPLIMRYGGRILHFLNLSSPPDAFKWDGLLLSSAAATLMCNPTLSLYELTLHHTNSPTFALLSSLLSLIPNSPATAQFTGYSEPFFTFLSYKGMLFCARSQWLRASIAFSLAGLFRSNGVFLVGFVLWGLLIKPLLSNKIPRIGSISYSLLLTSVIFTPFICHQYSAYTAFCISRTPATWCSNFLPLVYTYVQRNYWNVGFLHYWSVLQLPNFLISAPPLALMISFSSLYLKTFIPRHLPAFFSASETQKPKSADHEARFPRRLERNSVFQDPFIAPHAIHALFLCTTVLLTSHVQIILRLGSSMPILYWAATWLLIENPLWGRLWVGWSLLWALTSCVLWGVFLPPA